MTNLSFDNLNLNPENELFEVSLNIFSKNSWDVSGENGYHAILTGHNVSPISEVYIEMVKHYLDLDIESLCNLFTDKSLKFILECQSEFKNSLSHYDYLTENLI